MVDNDTYRDLVGICSGIILWIIDRGDNDTWWLYSFMVDLWWICHSKFAFVFSFRLGKDINQPVYGLALPPTARDGTTSGWQMACGRNPLEPAAWWPEKGVRYWFGIRDHAENRTKSWPNHSFTFELTIFAGFSWGNVLSDHFTRKQFMSFAASLQADGSNRFPWKIWKPERFLCAHR